MPLSTDHATEQEVQVSGLESVLNKDRIIVLDSLIVEETERSYVVAQ